MARITVEQELRSIPNRYELTLVAAYRAREIAHHGDSRVPRERDKPTIVALREIRAGKVGRELLSRVGTPVEQ